MPGTSNPIIEGPYWRDILDQPQALSETLVKFRTNNNLFSRIAQFKQNPHHRVLLTGMGSSMHALYPLELKLTAFGEFVTRAETAELIHSMPALLDTESILVAVSQSGKSAETVRLLEQNHSNIHTIGVTNTADSPLGIKSNILLLTHCGSEFSVSTKTYIGTLAALEILSAIWCGESAESVCTVLEEINQQHVTSYLASWRDHVQQLTKLLTGIHRLFFVGRGISLAACGVAALTIKESTRFSAEAMSSASFRHGPLEVVAPDTMVFVFEGEEKLRPLNKKLVHDIRANGGKAELIGPGAGYSSLRIADCSVQGYPIVEILPVQMITLALAALLGLEAGRFEHASKITSEE